jgi:exonuclease SbcC
MRPVTLEASGFAAFRDPILVNFDGVDFFALVGPTGSGKSSVIDAMCFALYGSVPRYEDQKIVSLAITAGASVARVSFAFEANGERYVATRVVRRTPAGGATTKEARLERLLADGTTAVEAGTASELTSRVGEILGLPFDHFTKCVVLPQGEFARFLHDKPAARQDLLVRLLNFGVYERMRIRANQLAAEAESRAEFQRRELEELAFATAEAEAEAKRRVRELGQLTNQVHKAAPAIERLDAAVAEATANAASAHAFVDLLGEVTVPGGLVAHAEQQREAVSLLESTNKKLLAAEADVAKDAERLANLPKPGPLEAALAAHQQLLACTAEIAETEEILSRAGHALAKTAEAVASHEKKTELAHAAVEELMRAHAAHDLSTHLVEGELCPVCLQEVEHRPRRKAPAGLAAAEKAAKNAASGLTASRSAHTEAVQNAAKAAAALETLKKQGETLEKALVVHPDRGAVESLLAQVEVARQKLEKARARAAREKKVVSNARSAVDDAQKNVQKFGTAFHTQRDRLAPLSPPPPSGSDLMADWTALATWAADEVPRQRLRAEGAEAEAAEKGSERHRSYDDLSTACMAAGVALEVENAESLSAIREEVIRADVEAKAVLSNVTAARSRAKRLRRAVADTLEEAEVAKELGKLLSANHFERWLVTEALQALVTGASVTLLRLSDGQYSLACDEHSGDFLVVDHHSADETRSARTLSGGETFQASLALALSLADQLAGLAADGAARLESIFLDEGFGTLDQETLVTVADTIETLGHDDRMVGVVTHVRELADRIPVRYVVTKGARTSTVEMVTA